MSRYRFRPWMALAILLLLLVAAFFGTFFAYGGKGAFASAPQSVAGSVAAPVVGGANSFAASVKDFFNRLFALRDVDKKYNDLITENQRLEIENQFMQDLQQENERLHNLLDAKEEKYPDYRFITAKVIGKDSGSNWFMSFTLNRGSRDGITPDMSVVNEDGLVGRVVEVDYSTCKVQAVIDPQSAVSAINQRSLDFGMVCGAGDANGSEPTCSIDYLPMDADMVPGDKIVTSNLGGVFYSGIVIGTVGAVGRDENNNVTAELIPAVDFSHILNVLILTKPESQATAGGSPQAGATGSPGASDVAGPTPTQGSGKGDPADTQPADASGTAGTDEPSQTDQSVEDIPG